MRTLAIRVVVTGAAVAAAAASLASTAFAAAPHGQLTAAEYSVLLPAFQRLQQLSDAADATPAQYAQVCPTIAPRSTHLIATEYRECIAVAQWAGAAARFSALNQRCPKSGSTCLARELQHMETSTRSVIRAAREERAAVSARGLTGACRRAFVGSAKTLPVLELLTRGLRNMRHAVQDGNANTLRHAARQVQRAVRQAAQIQDTDSAALLTQCPRS